MWQSNRSTRTVLAGTRAVELVLHPVAFNPYTQRLFAGQKTFGYLWKVFQMLLRPSLRILTLRSARRTSSEPATKRRLAPRSRHPPAPSRGQRHPPRLLAEAVSWRSAGRAFRDDKAEVPVVQPSGDKASAQVPRSCHVMYHNSINHVMCRIVASCLDRDRVSSETRPCKTQDHRQTKQPLGICHAHIWAFSTRDMSSSLSGQSPNLM